MCFSPCLPYPQHDRKDPCHWPAVPLAPCGPVDDQVALGLCLGCVATPCHPEELAALDLSSHATQASLGFSIPVSQFCLGCRARVFSFLHLIHPWHLKITVLKGKYHGTFLWKRRGTCFFWEERPGPYDPLPQSFGLTIQVCSTTLANGLVC